MVSLLEKSVIRHFKAIKSTAGVKADYVSGGATIVENLTVVPASRLTGTSNAEGLITLSNNDDILILASDLPGHKPKGGDEIQIKDDAGTVVQTNTVDRSPPADFEDSYRLILRVHTKVTG